jgi:hypothetical protein
MSISTVTSEALQLKLRQLLPSQQGFGTDLSASDTIIPIIDLTASAEGSDVREDLQKALAFGSNTFTALIGTSNTAIESGTGFFRVVGSVTCRQESGANTVGTLLINDGATSKTIFQVSLDAGSEGGQVVQSFDFIVFLRSGDTFGATTSNSTVQLSVSVRQVADSNGTLVQPVGFTPS